MSETLKSHIALTTVALIYGSNYIIAKDVMNGGYIGPVGFILLRVVSATILFWIFHSIFIKEKVDRKDLLYLAGCGVFGVAVNQICFFLGLEKTSPIHASLIMTSSPILVLIVSQILIRKGVSLRKILGIILGLIGAILLIVQAGSSSGTLSSIDGDLLIFVNAASYAIYLVMVKKMLAKYAPLTVIKWVFTFGLVYVLPLGWKEASTAAYETMSTSIWLSIGFVLLFTTFLAYLLNAFALSTLSASTASFYIYFQPLIATSISIFAGRESLQWYHILAAILLFSGVYLVSVTKTPLKRA